MALHPWKHFCTITKHRHMVMRYCFRVGLYRQGLCHDLSKYSPAEFWAGARYYRGNRSPNSVQREQEGYSTAWMHHKGRNRHHFEFWTDLQKGKVGYQPVPMPYVYLVESVMDRIAACKVYRGDDYYPGAALDYLESSIEAKIMHPETLKTMREILTRLRDRGEKETFRYLRESLRHPTP